MYPFIDELVLIRRSMSSAVLFLDATDVVPRPGAVLAYMYVRVESEYTTRSIVAF